MAGRRVVSRNHKTVGVDKADDEATGAKLPSKRSFSPLPPSPVKNPFKTKKGRWWIDSTASKCVLVGLCCCFCWLAWSGLPGLRSLWIDSRPRNRGRLHLRPAYLTDDGKGDEDDADDGGEEEGDENDDTDAPTDGTKEEKEERIAEDPNVRKQEPKVRVSSSSGRRYREEKKQHKIPKVLIFTHYKNLLELLPPELQPLLLGKDDITDNHPPDIAAAAANTFRNMSSDELEEYTLATNVLHSIDVHNRSDDEELRVLFWTDEDCIQSLERTRPGLVLYFKKETEGMYKADMCRGTALLEHGGFYLDVDVGVRHDLWKDLQPTTEFVTARVHQASNWVGKGFFQAVLGASRGSPVLSKYLELFEQHYDGTRMIQKGPLGVLLLASAWEMVREEHKRGPKRFPEVSSELYQEFLFHQNGPFDKDGNKGVISPAPTWGKRRACHFVVAGRANDPSNAEIVLEIGGGGGKNDIENKPSKKDQKKTIGLQIPVLSRIPGSRMCAETDPNEGGSHNTTGLIRSMKWWERT